MTINWKNYNNTANKTHGDLEFYRKMYDGDHGTLFPRAISLISKGEIVDSMLHGKVVGKNVQVPYIVANVSKVIVDIAATFVTSSLGDVKTTLGNDQEQNERVADKTADLIDGENDETRDGKIENFQQEFINQVALGSELINEHWSNVVQLQVDGGLVGVPWKDEDGITIQFKSRDMYYPHKDGKGADLAYVLENDEDEPEYLHIYRERQEKGDLIGTHMLFNLNDMGETEQLDEELAKEILGMDSLTERFIGRSRKFITYLSNEKTFMHPLGNSVLKGLENKQDEINWTLTRSAITFERNGKPRLAVSKEVMQRLQDIAMDQYGDPSKIDHRNMEVMTFDDNGKSLEIIQLDVTKIGDFETVKNYIKQMLQETQTSEKAVDFYMDGGGSGAASGIAKYYDLLITILKAQRLQNEYVSFLQDLFEGALWLARQDDKQVRLERPDIERSEMLQVSNMEASAANNAAFTTGTMSRSTAIRRNSPGRSEEWYENEEAMIEAGKQSTDIVSLGANGRSTLANALDNRPTIAVEAQKTNPIPSAVEE